MYYIYQSFQYDCMLLSRTCREVFVVNDFYACFRTVATVVHCRKLISYPGISVQTVGGSFKKKSTLDKTNC
jgi:hypothetical protein